MVKGVVRRGKKSWLTPICQQPTQSVTFIHHSETTAYHSSFSWCPADVKTYLLTATSGGLNQQRRGNEDENQAFHCPAFEASNPDKVQRHGRCPLTPEEVVLMLRALGFGSDIHLYVASGEVYGVEETLAPLKKLFPNYHSKETIASKEELTPFSSFSSRMAALDFIVCDESDVFITNNNGNMARMLAGRRRYFGHKPTIRPNAKKLSLLFMNHNNMTWEEFASKLQTNQIGFMGELNVIKPGRGEFHENPAACICSASGTKSSEVPIPQNESFNIQNIYKEDDLKKDSGYVTDGQITEDEQDWSGIDYTEMNINRSQGKVLPSVRVSDPGLLLKPDEPELEDFFSD
ncbi:unnamed protein product [Prunus armeniaca]|uniref:O-fucosyltransferase family protein n=1 Tax=Prunus armeniaca TaxID=36596 RepID=A0A6J5VSU1_PRUAR|nr:unnamed protein product [Prunus armeniaca]